MRTLMLAVLLAVLGTWAGRRVWRVWRYDGDRIPFDLWRHSA